ncbi:NADH:flavin oxidoreductase/NADH oxidase [Arvimicrobium flavum]|uniref:NADH:flavin oxidoreductase/NADH oxidase n=1 Tax=Arvimicrobium flavum TaxID=3393320 RepID=UPI00237AACD9|nr:NADH:flavin oxidoreductase/NADH oxidase [Mesorhizobium shangrilense]
MTDLFSPISIGTLEFKNRIAVAPMCQYSADDGSASVWHLYHWMNFAMSGAAMVTVEMTDVERRGRISHGCLGLYSDANEDAAKRTLIAARRVANPGTWFGTQLAHAGRKASCTRPWEGGAPLQSGQDPWQTVSASAIPFDAGWQTPQALTETGIRDIIEKFGEAARRAERAGFDFIELHAAHGYLIHQFLSPLSNHRTDDWGGSLDNRMRFAVEVAREVRRTAPGLMLGARLSVKDWVDGGLVEHETVEVVKALQAEGVSYVCCSSGGNSPLQQIPTGPGYQVHLAEYVRQRVDIPVRAVGMIDEPHQANDIVAQGRADFIALGRALLADPRWPWRAAAALGRDITVAPQFQRAAFLSRKWEKAA